MTAQPFVAQWGILGCGWISSEFAKDISFPTTSRGTTDVSHAIAAVGSRSLPKAEEFIKKWCPDGAIAQKEGHVKFAPKAYGSYKEVVDDPNVNIVYVGTMNIAHYEDAKLALEGNKHCLVEKPASLNAAEWNHLVSIARAKKLFLMEGVWTRFNPMMLAVQKAVHEDDVIGEIRCMYSDHSMDVYKKRPDTDRLLSAELAGGCLLDIGPYPMVWTMMILYRHPKNQRTPAEKLGSTMMKYHTGVDLATGFTMTFPKLNAIAYCTTNLLSCVQQKQNTRIVGSKGEILVHGYTSRPTGYTIRRFIDPESEGAKCHPDEEVKHDIQGFGLYWEADEVARCLRDGKTECERMPLEETTMTMKYFDQIRKEGGYEFLPGLEKVKSE
ncbi:dimeric dihydrodiol dehydrogenase [Kwoniella heveanensis BCC8398]|uniref:D-xylose 1-dehydrogenase (NADP(+), D-xylono-1,5-lactone-forming) n=1 Tax=Kwoniella heveanensis BCC8398 TaxID=1296120 RepID=A0A1B9H3D6_9TREE|nr:dimeric dihydrodiol dehydrogenase [Kwoniella heveanensis BCC8398]